MENESPVKTPIDEVEGGWLHQLVVYAARYVCLFGKYISV